MALGDVKVQVSSKELQAKSLIMRAWRERWTEVQWGINIRQLADAQTDGSFLSDCILQQALSGPGPNSLVLSYLLYSIHSQIVTTSSVLLSVSKYDAFYKPFCVTSLLDLLDSIKERIILNDHQGKEECMQLALALQSVVLWLLSCMYNSLETLSDAVEFPAEAEDSKIVLKCRNLVDYFLNDAYILNLIQVANKEDEESFLNIKKMSKEVDTFVNGHHKNDITHVTALVDKLSSLKIPKPSNKILPLHKTYDGLQMKICNPSIQAIIMRAVLLKTSQDVSGIVSELVLVKELQGIDTINFYSEILHACVMGLAGAFGNKDHELTFVGFTFLQLPTLMSVVREKLADSGDSLLKGLETFIMNESCLNITDTKLHCCTLEFLLSSFAEIGLINDNDKTSLLAVRAKKGPSLVNQNAGSSPVILRAELTLMPLLKTLDGDYQKNQDSILAVLCDVISNNDKTFNVILTAAATTGRLQQFTSRLIRLNQLSRQEKGEVTKAANSRAMIFDLSFLMLCYVVQHHGEKALAPEESDTFFEEWYRDCMIEDNTVKNPDIILSRCDPNKVDLLLNQYIQGDTELKTSLVFWHEVCIHAVGVTREILTAWEADSITFTEVKRILDVFRSKICSIPVCIAAWLCAYIQVTPGEKCEKAKEILNYLLSSLMTFENQDHFKERNALMVQIISRMMNSVLPGDNVSPTGSPALYNFETKPVAVLYKNCWTCMNNRGLIDVETALNLQHLLQMSGPHFFVQNLVEEMLRLQHSQELSQRCDLLYGILQYDLRNCTPALVRVVVPTVLQFWTNDSSLMEPQIKALASLTVDCILAYFYHATFAIKIKEEKKDETDGEPQAKRRKGMDLSNSQTETIGELHVMLKELYEEFSKLLHNVSEATPAVEFVLQFLEHLSMKTPSLTLLGSLPPQVVTQLISLMFDDINPEILIGLYYLSSKASRLNCAQALCRLKHLKYTNEHHQPRSFSPAPGS